MFNKDMLMYIRSMFRFFLSFILIFKISFSYCQGDKNLYKQYRTGPDPNNFFHKWNYSLHAKLNLMNTNLDYTKIGIGKGFGFNIQRLTSKTFGFNLGLEFLLKKLTPQQERKAFEKIVLLMVLILTVASHASRLRANVVFNVNMPKIQKIVPFTVIAPKDFSGQFVRFVHPFNGKSAVAKVVKREGKQYKTNPDLAKAIGIQSNVARVFIEEVY